MKTKLSGRVHQALVCRAGRYSANHHIIISINECECYAILENLKSIYIYQQIKEVLASECLTTLTGWQEGDLATNDSHKSYSKSAYLQAECPSSCISNSVKAVKGTVFNPGKYSFHHPWTPAWRDITPHPLSDATNLTMDTSLPTCVCVCVTGNQQHSTGWLKNTRLSSFFFFLSLLRAELLPTSGPQSWDHVTVQCALAQGEERNW